MESWVNLNNLFRESCTLHDEECYSEFVDGSSQGKGSYIYQSSKSQVIPRYPDSSDENRILPPRMVAVSPNRHHH